MTQRENSKKGNKKENLKTKTEKWIDKTEKYIDDSAEKMHNSDTYREIDQSMEKAAKNIFRKAGKLWGKSERYFNAKKKSKKSSGGK